jgi:AcrR family transcriptional regulator
VARPSVITDQQILQAARDLFLKKGITATTAEVARRARIAEASIFKRYKTKYELFCAAMQVNPAEEPAFFRSLDDVKTGHPRQVLAATALEILGFLRTMMPLMMMTWSNPSPSGLPGALDTANPLPLQALQKLTAFFEREMRAGRVRRQDPQMAARIFLGSIQNYVLFELLLRARHKHPMSVEKFVKQMVDTLWRGMIPRRKKE